MFFDPTCKFPAVTTKPDTWSLRTLISWLETMPPDEEYCFTSLGLCLIAQYLRAKGWPAPSVDPYHADDWSTHERMKLPKGWNDLAYGNSWNEKNPGQNFGAALARARELSASAEHVGEKS